MNITEPDEDLIIETDEQTREQYKNDKEVLYKYDPEQEVGIKEDKMSVFEYMRKYEQGRLKTDPDYQRNLVWNDKQMSLFIESILLGYPIPPFYLNQQKDNTLVIIDGLQRTTTMYKFMKLDEFPLKNLEIIKDLNGKRFSELSTYLQAKIEDKMILFYIIKPSVPIEIVYDLFNRINTGGTPLNRQEVRNCIFLGKSTELLKELAEEDIFRKAIDNGISPKRMKDREIILRYLSFKIFDYEKDYEGDLSPFVEKAMRKINDMSDSEIEELKTDFRRVMKKSHEFFNNRNFRFPIENNKGLKTRGFINTAMLESIAYFFSVNTDEFLEDNKQAIKRNFETLLTHEKYVDAVRFSTGSTFRVVNRFKLAQEILGEV